MNMTQKQRQWLDNTLAKLVADEWGGLRGYSWACAALGICEDDAIALAREAGVRKRDSDIRRSIRTARERGAGSGQTRSGAVAPRDCKTEHQPTDYEAQTVARLLAAGRGATEHDLLGASGYKPTGGRGDAVAWLRRLWRDDDLLVCRSSGSYAAKLGWNVRSRAAWELAVERGEPLTGDLVGIASISPEAARSMDGRHGGVGKANLASPLGLAVLEFDELPLGEQVAFWCGFLRRCPLAPSLRSLTHSGGRSIHAVLDLDLRDGATREERLRLLRSWFCSSPDERLRCDENALNATTATRIPSVRRTSNGEVQRLLYLA